MHHTEIQAIMKTYSNTVKEFEVFADCIVNDKKVEMDGVEGARVVAICLAIVESSETGKIVIPNYEF